MRARNPIGGKYDSPLNRESAYQILKQQTLEKEGAGSASNQIEEEEPSKWGFLGDWLWGTKRRQGVLETMAKQTARTIGNQIGRQILRGLLGGILGGYRRR